MFQPIRHFLSLSIFLLLGMTLLAGLACVPTAWAQGPTPGQNVNMVSGMTWPWGDPFLERQDEPSLGVSTRNPLHLLAGANDYRTVDLNTLLETEPGEVSVCPTPGVTPCPASAEPWVGQYISIDGGARWQSTLLPGYPQDRSAQGAASPLHGFSTAADPVIASGTNGMFYYGGIAFNRGSSQGLVFVARYMDLNNKENGDITQDSFPVRYIDTLAVAHGSQVPANFLDKPAIAVDIPRGSSTCTINVPQAGASVQQTIPAGNVYVAYANVATSSSGNITSTIYFTHSTNCGQSWSTPQAISHGYNLSQGATIQIDPETGIVYVAWRVIHSGTQQPNDGIAIAASLDGGNRFFGPLTLVSLPPFNAGNPKASAFFDQGTTFTSFRTTAYPAMAVADSGIAFVPGPLYLAWSQRGIGLNGEAEARIMMLAIPGNGMFTSSGFKLPTPFVVDNGAITNDIGGTFPLLTSGFQVMPAMTFNQGKLMLIYYDLRQDHTTGSFAPRVSLTTGDFMPDAIGNFFEETRDQVPESATCDVPLYFISDACLTKRRKTIDLVLAQSNPGLGVPTFTYSRVSHYDFGLFAGELANTFHQVKYDPPNLPMFAKGLAAFLGDYLGIAGQPFVLVKCGNSQCWTYNNPSPPGVAGTFFAAPKPAPSSAVHYATWTSNQDVIPPVDGDWTTYIPVTSGTSVYNGSPTQACVFGTNNGHEGDRNQNVYSSRITQGLSITSPQTSKPLSSTVQRGFVILLQNQSSGRPTSSGFVNYFRLSIANQPVNGFASFAQLVPPGSVKPPPFPAINGNGMPFPQASVDVAIAPHTGVARTVFAVSSNPTASILVNVTEMDSLGAGAKVVPGGLSGFILLNADGTVPTSLVDPNVPSGDPNNISNVELYDPNVSAPNVSAPNVSAPNVSAPNVSAPNVSAPNVSAANLTAPNVSAPNVSAYGLVNPNVSAPNVSAPNVSAAPPQSDGTYTVTNNRNTNASYNVAVIGQSSTRLQLLLSQIYMTPQTDGQCGLIAQQQNITLANVPNTPITPPDQLSSLTTPNVSAVPVTSPSFSLGPHDTAYITLRGNVDVATMKQILMKVAPAIIPQGIKSNDTTSTTPPIIAPLFITTATLPNTVVGGQQYNPGVQLQAIGGTLGSGECSVYFWNWLGAPDSGIPPGLTISTRGVISGTPTAPGTYNVLVHVSTCIRGEVATRVLTIRVLAPLAITTTSLPTATRGISYGQVPLSASGGIGNYNWTVTSGSLDGLTLSRGGVLTGTPAATGTFPFTATVSDSGPPSQSVSSTMTLNVIPAAPAPPTNVAIGSVSPTSVRLIWEFSTSSGVMGYNVYRATTSGGQVTKLGSVTADAFSFTDNTVVGGQTYFYVVTAFNSNNVESAASNQVSTPIAVAPLFFGQATDPVGDGGSPDLVFASITTFNDNTAKLSVRFAAGTFNRQTTVAEFSLDTDQNVATGRPGIDGGCSAPDSGLIGTDYVIDLASDFAGDQASIYNATGNGCNNVAFIANALVTIFADGMDVTVPLSTLTNAAAGPATPGPWNFKVTTQFNLGSGQFSAITDRMPDTGTAPASTASAPLPITPPSGMVAWYPADGYPTDIQNNHGGIFNSITYAPSEVGQSFVFDGVSSAITVTDAPDLTPTSLTVDFWFMSNINLPDATNHPQIPLIYKLDPADDANIVSKGYDFFYQFGALGFGLPSTGGARTIVYSSTGSTSITAGTWHHLAGTYDSSGQKLYLDGQLVNSGPNFGPIQYQSAAIQFGRVVDSAVFPPNIAGTSAPYYFNGQIDEVEIYNRALSASEIMAIFNAGAAGKAKP
jgi:concanavalin A-like lectin/glucanase superfamily protein